MSYYRCHACESVLENPDRPIRCAGCCLRAYCSKACQDTDWYTNGHRSMCKLMKRARKTNKRRIVVSDDQEVNMMLYKRYMFKKRYMKAVEYSRAVLLDSGSPNVIWIYQHAVALREAGKYSDARVMFDAALLELGDNQLRAKGNILKSYMIMEFETKNYARAIEMCERGQQCFERMMSTSELSLKDKEHSHTQFAMLISYQYKAEIRRENFRAAKELIDKLSTFVKESAHVDLPKSEQEKMNKYIDFIDSIIK